MFFGSIVFKPVRAQRKPPGTDRVLNWAAYGLWEDQNKHLLSDKEVADKKKLNKAASNLLYSATPKGKVASASNSRRYRATPKGQYKASAAGNKRARVLLEAHDNSKRPAVQQKTNDPQVGCLGALLGGS
jgi:hypothetical protein